MSAVEIAGVTVEPGTRVNVSPTVSEAYTGDRTTLPMTVINGAGDGPRLFVTAAVHGDELNGTAVCGQLLDLVDPEHMRGVLIVVPIVNVLGAQVHSRYLPDRRDLNRSFPGTLGGSMASRLARLLMDEVVRGSDVGIDLHTAANRRTNAPQIRVDTDDRRATELAMEFGAPFVLHGPPRPGSLRAVAGEEGVPVLTYEAGEILRFEEEAIDIGVAGCQRIMAELDMIDEAPEADEPEFMASSRWMRAERGGLLSLHVSAGERVEEGQELWTTLGALGAERATSVAQEAGIVIGATTLPLVSPGDAVVHLGMLDGGDPFEDDPSEEEHGN
ncbi:MAG: succinylglutamate desuccinylase/aspartoacylase family protein [Nitriliruptorales bacterium]|nr:succinylglutamate desuccinylase/aspartoacylase family protein [Nitriliruptorales bacterium]